MVQIEEHQNNRETAALVIPRKADGSRFELSELQDDQRDVAVYVLKRIREWVECMEDDKPFKPLRLTVQGAAGTGKSVLINTLVTVLREMFQGTNSVLVFAPTGSAAHKAFGETFHRTFGVPIESYGAEMKKLSKDLAKRLGKRFRQTVIGIADERSLLSLFVAGYASHNFAAAAYGGVQNGQHSFGGIPALILIGDDCQIPPALQKGIFACPICDSDKRESQNKHFSQAETIGMNLLVECAEDVMELTRKKRQNSDQEEYRHLLDDARVSDLSWEDADRILDELHLTRGNYTDEERKEICKGALFVSANREPVEEYNFLSLTRTSDAENPVAVIKSTMRSRSGGAAKKSHFDDRCPLHCLLCIGAMVALKGWNFYPEWGLFNGSIGTVKEIVFKPDANPNEGDLPLYVVIEFSSYCGPIWDENNPKVRRATHG